MESKAEMRSRGVASPDIADAFCMAFGIEEAIQRSYMPFDDTGRQEIARKLGWDYPSDNDSDSGFPGRGDNPDNSGSGGVWSIGSRAKRVAKSSLPTLWC